MSGTQAGLAVSVFLACAVEAVEALTIVLATFALGTAAGDLTATSLGLGFFPSALLFAGLIAIPAVGWSGLGMNPILAFWSAYVLTRPLGASFADWFSKPHSITGLGLGDGTVSAIALAVFVALVALVAVTRRDIQQPSAEGFEAAHAEPAAVGLDGVALQPLD